ncbi:IS21 family transposase [Alkaliphilus hydrothermalis]|uniref:Transposase n=1 Tax=Alkaliphilus hydrothermalis TaxID=1482730 RepID=A0ABS2NQT3_9FIRM|nr:IS21 family transposase [Alkaliphilus hydrothermalis]MBM7615152.1 transposase [Alkaliphilus hydrothermalis]
MKGVIINVDVYQQIREMSTIQGMSQRAIARTLGISRNTVKKYCDGNNVPWDRKEYSRKADVLTDDVLDFILQCLEEDKATGLKKQQHTARRIYQRLVDEKEFTGSESTIRSAVSRIKASIPKSFIPLEFDPGEALQVDWGTATIYLDGVKTTVNLFCARLCFSCAIFVRAFKQQNEESFLEGQMQAFEYFGGIPHKVIFDNARVAVKEGFGQYAKLQNRYKAFSAHYAFQPTFCNVASGNEKGLVENLVGLARRNFLVPVPKVKDLTILNHLLLEKCNQYKQHVIQGREGSVETRLRQELPYFYSLPKYRFDTSKTVTAIVNEYSTVRFEKNNYSVPAFHIGKEVTVKAFGNSLEIYHKATKVASYERIYGSGGQTKYTLEHYMSMLEQKPRAVFHAKPVRQNIQKELLQWTTSFPNGNRDTVKLLRLCLDYGVDKILSIKKQIPSDVQPSIDLVLSYLDVPTATNIIPIHKDVVVDTVDLSEYDKKYGMAVSK